MRSPLLHPVSIVCLALNWGGIQASVLIYKEKAHKIQIKFVTLRRKLCLTKKDAFLIRLF